MCLIVIEVHLNLVKYRNDDVIKWDVKGYYSYLPALFIDHDLSLRFITPENKSLYSGVKYAYVDDDKGNHVIKYPMGMAVLYTPFFLAAHALATPLGYKQDGFSDIYQFCIEFSGLFYLLIGFWFLRKLLLQFYSEKMTATTLLFIFFGTNLLYYSSAEAAMSHAYTFSLFSVFLYYVFEFYKEIRLRNVILLALCFGLIVLIRPLNVFLIMPLLLFKMNSVYDLKTRFLFFIKNYKYILVFALIVTLVLLPQLIYYKHVTGNWLVFSYGKERFYFTQLHQLDALLGFRKGWLIYTPVMLFALIGVWYMRKQTVNGFTISILILVPLYFYLVSSWWCWWYGGSFGLRAMIDVYPLLALPLAALFYKLNQYDIYKRRLAYVVLGLLLFLNLFQTVQYKYNIIDYDGMTFKSYVHVFGTLDDEKIDTTLLKKPDYEKAVLGLSE